MRPDDAPVTSNAHPADRIGERPPIGRTPVTLPLTVPPLPLAHGELSERDAAELIALKRQIQGRVGFVCDGYKEKCLRRRIAVRMRARGVHTYSQYGSLLDGEPAEYERLVDTLTINVSKFFRNPDVWDAVREKVLPPLFASDARVLNVWSAGAAAGEEAYTIAMLMHDYAHAHDESTERFRVLGTDIDRDSLRFAQRAEYSDFAMTDTDAAVRERWFDRDGAIHRPKPVARERVTFATLDLIRDEFPQEQHLIFCRNVIIYFERAVQEALFRRFHDALAHGGFLVLGKVEALFGAAPGLFQAVANRQRVFRKA
jgi:chemotaxis methyl-accepting protein methylase